MCFFVFGTQSFSFLPSFVKNVILRCCPRTSCILCLSKHCVSLNVYHTRGSPPNLDILGDDLEVIRAIHPVPSLYSSRHKGQLEVTKLFNSN